MPMASTYATGSDDGAREAAPISSRSALVGASLLTGRPESARYSARKTTVDLDTPSSRAMAGTVLVRSGHSSTKRCIRSAGPFRRPLCMTTSDSEKVIQLLTCRYYADQVTSLLTGRETGLIMNRDVGRLQRSPQSAFNATRSGSEECVW